MKKISANSIVFILLIHLFCLHVMADPTVPDLDFDAQEAQSIIVETLRSNKDFGETPLYFITNKGQVDLGYHYFEGLRAL